MAGGQGTKGLLEQSLFCGLITPSTLPPGLAQAGEAEGPLLPPSL